MQLAIKLTVHQTLRTSPPRWLVRTRPSTLPLTFGSSSSFWEPSIRHTTPKTSREVAAVPLPRVATVALLSRVVTAVLLSRATASSSNSTPLPRAARLVGPSRAATRHPRVVLLNLVTLVSRRTAVPPLLRRGTRYARNYSRKTCMTYGGKTRPTFPANNFLIRTHGERCL